MVTFDEGIRILVEYLERRMAAHDDPMERIAAWIEGALRQAAPPAASRTLPWSLGSGRLALRFPEQFRLNEAAIVAPLAREIANAEAAGAGHSPGASGDAWLIFGYTLDTVTATCWPRPCRTNRPRCTWSTSHNGRSAAGRAQGNGGGERWREVWEGST